MNELLDFRVWYPPVKEKVTEVKGVDVTLDKSGKIVTKSDYTRRVKTHKKPGRMEYIDIGAQYHDTTELWYANEYGIVMQWTGLYDKNGKKIYGGDIVYVEAFSPEKHIVRFNRGGFCLEPITGIESHFWPDIKYAEDDRSEVIGDIYENPELLK
jgi:uncharacterized phage protein (TIGR01671 family)